MDSQVIITAISTVGGIVITFLTLKYKGNLNKKNKGKEPMETIFDGYGSLIKELKEDSERKSIIIDNLQLIIDAQKIEIQKSQEMIDTLRSEVDYSTAHATELKKQLDKMKKDYLSKQRKVNKK